MNNYYKQKQIIARVDRNGNVVGKIEKWEAHKKGVLHRALTVALIYNGQYIIQHRKHPAFDRVFDVTSSSHQLFTNGKLQTTEEAAFDCLNREWELEKTDLSKLKNMGAIYYKAKDEKSIYTEHEMCEILVVEINVEPKPNLDFAYGFSLVSKQELMNKDSKIYENLAPWVKKMIEENKL
ncbi:MAG: Isopentenyl-diphosphate Delta-isomerase [Microgenomates group bacterium GW2011_GWA2_37_6]|nr:MAG: Isopentenyl-diphosphate Delta-isomerase [Microgenomates group bacterium GW2011_GWA2_37_6]